MSRSLRSTIAAVLVAACASAAPSQALTPGRHAVDGPARIAQARGFVAWILALFEYAPPDSGGGMDPNGSH
jgi:hypothetical protein